MTMLAFDFYGTYSKYKDPFKNREDYKDFIDRVKKDYNIPQHCDTNYHSLIFDTNNRAVVYYWCLFRSDCENGIHHLNIEMQQKHASLVSLDGYLIEGYIGDIR